MRATVCQGCGGLLPPPKDHDHRRKWCSERCRKRSYGDPCVDCGKPTRFGAESTRVPEPRCRLCSDARRKFWTRDALLGALRAWADTYGEPPASPDWSPTFARYLHDEERATRFEDAAGAWPHSHTVIREFGSWNAGIQAAGFEPRAAHGGGGNQARRRNQRVAA